MYAVKVNGTAVTFNNKWSLLAVLGVLILVISVGVFKFILTDDIINGYYYSGQHRLDDVHISKNGKIVVSHNIVSMDVISNYIVGLRLPGQYLECENGSSANIILSNKKEYFILDTNSGDTIRYESAEKFNQKLSELDIFKYVQLDYTRFDVVWNYYSYSYKDIDFSQCESTESHHEFISHETKLLAEKWDFPLKSELASERGPSPSDSNY